MKKRTWQLPKFWRLKKKTKQVKTKWSFPFANCLPIVKILTPLDSKSSAPDIQPINNRFSFFFFSLKLLSRGDTPNRTPHALPPLASLPGIYLHFRAEETVGKNRNTIRTKININKYLTAAVQKWRRCRGRESFVCSLEAIQRPSLRAVLYATSTGSLTRF